MFKTTRGLILREVHYKEADRILTVLTEDMGKITVKARGALRKGSRTAAATQFLAYSELTMFENRGKWSVNEASTIEEFKGLRSDIAALSLASYFAECTEALSDEDMPDPDMLRLILNCLFALSNSMYAPEHIKTAFELRLMSIAGYEPELRACSTCGDTEPHEAYFSTDNGIILCGNCRRSPLEANIKLAPGALSGMRHMIYSDMRKMLSFSLSEDAAECAAKTAESFLLTQTERRFSTLDYWKQVK